MASRQITRRVVASVAIALFLIFLFIRPNGPPSPAVRAPGHIDHSVAPGITIHDDMLKGEVVMSKLGNETAKYDTYEKGKKHNC